MKPVLIRFVTAKARCIGTDSSVSVTENRIDDLLGNIANLRVSQAVADRGKSGKDMRGEDPIAH